MLSTAQNDAKILHFPYACPVEMPICGPRSTGVAAKQSMLHISLILGRFIDLSLTG